MHNLTRSQLETPRANMTLKSSILPPQNSLPPLSRPRPNIPKSTKRKASSALSTRNFKSGRNLSWNGFQNAEVHELSTDDEDDREKRRTKFASQISSHRAIRAPPTSYRSHWPDSQRYPNNFKAMNRSDDRSLPKKPLRSLGKSQELRESQQLSKHQPLLDSEMTSNNQTRYYKGYSPGEFASKKSTVSSEPSLSRSYSTSNAAETLSQRTKGTITSPIFIDVEPKTQLGYPKLTTEPLPTVLNLEFQGQNFENRSSCYDSGLDTNNDPDRVKYKTNFTELHQDLPNKNIQRKSLVLERAEAILSRQKDDSTTEQPRDIGPIQNHPNGVTLVCSDKESDSNQPLKDKALSPFGPEVQFLDDIEEDDDLQHALVNNVSEETIRSTPRILHDTRTTQNKDVLRAHCQQQRRKYGLSSLESYQEPAIDVSELRNQDYGEPIASGKINHDRCEADNRDVTNIRKSIPNAAAHPPLGKKSILGQASVAEKMEKLGSVALKQSQSGAEALKQPLSLQASTAKPVLPEDSSYAKLQINRASKSVPKQKSNDIKSDSNDSLFIADVDEPKSLPRAGIFGQTYGYGSGARLRKMEEEIQSEKDTLNAMKQKITDSKRLKERATKPSALASSGWPAANDAKTVSATGRDAIEIVAHKRSLLETIQDLGTTKSIGAQKKVNGISRIGHEEAATLINMSKIGSNKIRNSILRQPKKNQDKAPIDLGRITNDDWRLVKLRRNGWEWKDIHSRWQEWTGSEKSLDSLRKRFARIRATFPDLFPEEEKESKTADEKRQENLKILQKIRDGCEDEAPFATGDNVAINAQDEELRDVHAEKKLSAICSLKPVEQSLKRSKVAGKRLSKDLEKYILDSLNYGQDDLSESDNGEEALVVRSSSPEAEDDKVHFGYLVRRRTLRPGQSDDEVEWHVCSEVFSSMDEANSAAIAEVKLIRGDDDIRPITKWACEINEETGLMTHQGTGENGSIQVDIYRFLRTYYDGISPQSKIGWAKRRVFDVLVTQTTHDKTVEWEDDVVEEIELHSGSSADSADGTIKPSSENQSDTAGEKTDEYDYLFEENPSDGNELCQMNQPRVILRTITRTRTINLTTHVTETPGGRLSAIRDRANKLAGETLLKMGKDLDPNPGRRRPTIDNLAAERQAQDELAERLDQMEKDDESFDDALEIPGSYGESNQANSQMKTAVRVRVVERTLENPRNF